MFNATLEALIGTPMLIDPYLSQQHAGLQYTVLHQ